MVSSGFSSLLRDFVKTNVYTFLEDEFEILEGKFNSGVLLRADVEYDSLNRIRGIKNVIINDNGTIRYKTPIRAYKPFSKSGMHNIETLRNIILNTT